MTKGKSLCTSRCVVLFLLGVLVGAVTVGLLFFYRVLTPTDLSVSTFGIYNSPVQTIPPKTVPPVVTPPKTGTLGIGGGWGGLIQIGGGWGGMVK